MSLKGKKVLVLGGNGFLGKNLIDKLLEEDCIITSFDVNIGNHSPKVNYVDGNYVKLENFDDLVADNEIVFHLISTTFPNVDRAYEQDIMENLIPSVRLFETCAAKNAKVIFISSGGTVYGKNGLDIHEEDSPKHPFGSYAASKLCIENYLEVYGAQKKLDYRIVRLANPYGPYQRTNTGLGVIATFVERSLTTGCIDLYGTGDTVRDYIYSCDAATALVAIADYEGEERILNLGSGEGHSLLDVIKVIEEVSGRKFEINHVPMRKSDIERSVLDITRLNKCFPDLKLKGFNEGIKDFYYYMKGNLKDN